MSDLLKRSIGQGCHDVRSPLTAVYGFAKLLERQELDEKSLQYLAQIVNGSERLDGLLEQLSELGRIAAGRSTPELESVSVDELVVDLNVSFKKQPSLSVNADPIWLVKLIKDLIEEQAKTTTEELSLTVSQVGTNIHLVLQAPPETYMINLTPEQAALPVTLAHMRLLAMDGSLSVKDKQIIVALPTAN